MGEIYCSECCTLNKDKNYCIKCGHKLRKITNEKMNKKYCQVCGCKVNVDEEYCVECGSKIGISNGFRKCSVCGELIGEASINSDGSIGGEIYCVNCGHNTIKRSNLIVGCDVGIKDILLGNISNKNRIDLRLPKKCPNCNTEHQPYFNYCECCGTKLMDKKDMRKNKVFKLF